MWRTYTDVCNFLYAEQQVCRRAKNYECIKLCVFSWFFVVRRNVCYSYRRHRFFHRPGHVLFRADFRILPDKIRRSARTQSADQRFGRLFVRRV